MKKLRTSLACLALLASAAACSDANPLTASGAPRYDGGGFMGGGSKDGGGVIGSGGITSTEDGGGVKGGGDAVSTQDGPLVGSGSIAPDPEPDIDRGPLGGSGG